MIDIELIRKDPEGVAKIAAQKNVEVDLKHLLELDSQKRTMQGELDQLQQQRNELASSIKGKPSPEQVEQGKKLKATAADKEQTLNKTSQEFNAILLTVPNIPSEDTPIGADEGENKTLRTVGEKPEFNFKPKPHWELGKALGVIDSEKSAKITGSRFTYLMGELAQMQFALVQHAFNTLTNEKVLKKIAREVKLEVDIKSFIPVVPPVMIRPDVFERMGRLEPKDERYHIPSDDLYLVGSAEHTLGPLHMEETLAEATLPVRYVGYSTAFRREAGSHGKDVRGILRLHQFDKIEIESFTAPEQSSVEQEFIVAIQEHLMQSLDVPYQVILKCTGDMGTPNHRAIDLETWMPGQDAYRETHTSDLMTDYQARRLRTKIKLADNTKVYAHMNDATVFAIGRTLIAIMENHQQEDGSIKIPEALHRYLPFTKIENN